MNLVNMTQMLEKAKRENMQLVNSILTTLNGPKQFYK